MSLAPYRTKLSECSTGISVLLLACGLYFPSSFGAAISRDLNFAAYLLCAVVLMFILATGKASLNPTSVLVSLSIIPILLIFTLVSELPLITPGALFPYIVFCLFCCSNLLELECTKLVRWFFVAANALNIGAGFAIVAGNSYIRGFLTNYYSAFYPDLVQNMLGWRKPVLTFGTHSLAAFYLYLFFYASLRTFQVRRKKLFLVFAFSYLFLMLSLISVSGLLLATVGAFQLLWILWSSSRKLFGVAVLLILCGLPFAYGFLVGGAQSWTGILELGQAIVTEPNSGLLGRFGGGGYMHYDLFYLSQNPFAPVGVKYDEQLMFGDCGPVEYLLRGSILLLGAVYLGFFLFVKRNVISKSDRKLFFFGVLAFEVGYSALMAARTLFLFPFFVIYFNGLCLEESNS